MPMPLRDRYYGERNPRRCRECGGVGRVFGTRHIDNGTVIYRRRRCEDCNNRWSTWEQIVLCESDEQAIARLA